MVGVPLFYLFFAYFLSKLPKSDDFHIITL
nr:MAG TPA: hypothetical protein [Caudoviricetes sp.]